MTTARTQKEYVRTQLRIPPSLHEALVDAAARNGHSLNAEIMSRLQRDPVVAALDGLRRQNDELKDIAKRILENVAT